MTPEEEERVRRALADAPAAGPMPPEVAARLDAALAGLVAERSEAAAAPGEPAPVASLESRRRGPRRWPQVLVAAASVSVLAFGVGVVADGMAGSGGMDASTTEGRAADSGADFEAGEAAPEGATDGKGAAPSPMPLDGRAVTLLVDAPPAELSRQSLTEDVRRLLRRSGVAGGYTTGSQGPRSDREGVTALSRCDLPEGSRGDRMAAARLDGERATLVVRRAVDGVRVAEVYSCADGEERLAVTRVEVR